jgi:parallel beta-helix repeat protein
VITGYGVAIDISGSNASGNVIAGDWIGTDLAGNPVPNGVGTDVYINNAPSNTVGGSTAGAGNLIKGYINSGINIFGAQAQDNAILDNTITAMAGSGLAGIVIQQAVHNTLIGNTITGNTYAGIYLFGQGTSATNNTIVSNDLVNNGQYGILLTDVANVGGSQQLRNLNSFAGNKIDNVGIFKGSVTPAGQSLSAPRSKAHKPVRQAAPHPARSHRVATRPTAQHKGTPSDGRTGAGAGHAVRLPVHEPKLTSGPASHAPRRRLKPAAKIPHGPLAHHAAARLNHPRSAGG